MWNTVGCAYEPLRYLKPPLSRQCEFAFKLWHSSICQEYSYVPCYHYNFELNGGSEPESINAMNCVCI